MDFWNIVSTAFAGLLQVDPSKVCYPETGIGCFSNKPPYDNAQGLLPEPPGLMEIEFLLYTRANRHFEQIITKDPNSIRQSNFRGSRKTKLIIHGYREDGRKQWIRDMKNSILRKEDANVIVVDWKKGADKTDYRQAVANTRVVGAVIAKLLRALRWTANARYSTMHLIGYSLGAHVAGYAAERIHSIGRISGLDPAGPLFENKDPKVRLDPTDAKFVDVIHTDGDSLVELGFGLETPIGDADFYPNGGTNQPGCSDSLYRHVFRLLTGRVNALQRRTTCSHRRALLLYIESITSSCQFKAFPCPSVNAFEAGGCTSCRGSCATMGYYADKRARGTFYLRTASAPPFCQLHQ